MRLRPLRDSLLLSLAVVAAVGAFGAHAQEPPDPIDTDGDGLVGAEDSCPDTGRGRFDINGNGCPGPYGAFRLLQLQNATHIARRLVYFELHSREPGARTAFVLRERPPGRTLKDVRPSQAALLVLRHDSDVERLRTDARGTARSRLLTGRPWRPGSRLVLTVNKPGYVGFQISMTIVIRGRSSGIEPGPLRCIPAEGSQPARRCGSVGLGR